MEPYQPLVSLFLAPTSFRNLFPSIKSLINSEKFLSGEFQLPPPQSEDDHRLSLYQMKVLAKQQVDFINSISCLDTVLRFEKAKSLNQVIVTEKRKLRGRPKSQETLLKEIKSIEIDFSHFSNNLGYRNILKSVSNDLSKKVCQIDSLEAALLGKRTIREERVWRTESRKVMKDASVDNVQRMIDFGIGIPGDLSLGGKSDAESLDFFTQDISIQADLLNLSIHSKEDKFEEVITLKRKK